MRGTLADPVFLTLALAGFGLALIFSGRRRRLGQALIARLLALRDLLPRADRLLYHR